MLKSSTKEVHSELWLYLQHWRLSALCAYSGSSILIVTCNKSSRQQCMESYCTYSSMYDDPTIQLCSNSVMVGTKTRLVVPALYILCMQSTCMTCIQYVACQPSTAQTHGQTHTYTHVYTTLLVWPFTSDCSYENEGRDLAYYGRYWGRCVKTIFGLGPASHRLNNAWSS